VSERVEEETFHDIISFYYNILIFICAFCKSKQQQKHTAVKEAKQESKTDGFNLVIMIFVCYFKQLVAFAVY